MSESVKEYVCQCGRVFNNPQSFNGHRSHCMAYLGEEKYEESIKRLAEISKLAQDAIKQKSVNFHIQKTIELQQWVSEEHKCERCGKIMTEFYGSGRFCSKECARKRKLSAEAKLNISNSLKKYYSEKDISVKLSNRESSNSSKTIKRLDFSKYVDGTKDLYLAGIITYRNVKYYEIDKIEGEDFVICPYCGARFSQIQTSHLKKHNKKTSDVKLEFGDDYPIVSYKTHKNKSNASKESQMALISRGEHIGWQSRTIRSYAEIFWEKVLDNNNINYDPEHTIKKKDLHMNDLGSYFLDFLIDGFIDLEIDGKQHQYEDRKQSDNIRDNALKNNGYLIYRIPWINPVNSEAVKKQIDDFISWYHDITMENNIQSVNI